MNARSLLYLALLATAGCPFFPDDPKQEDEPLNIPPQVWITAGATDDSAGVDYKVQFEWRGADEDGIVEGYQFAIDDTSSVSAWTDTVAVRARILFSASEPGWFATDDTMSEWHTFFIRAIDNEGAASEPDSRHFNARTIAPSTRIFYPRILDGAPAVPDSLVVEWEGEDLDASNLTRSPAAYQCKLIRLSPDIDREAEILDSLFTSPNELVDPKRTEELDDWLLVPGDQHQLSVKVPEQPVGHHFVFCVRAIDEAQATEPRLERGDNWFLASNAIPACGPSITVRSPLFESVPCGCGPYEAEVEVPAETPVWLSWTGRPSNGQANYGLDIPDPWDHDAHDHNGIGGYIGWGKRDAINRPFVFPASDAGTTHEFTLRARHYNNDRWPESRCTIRMRVLAPVVEGRALLVDDARINYMGPAQDDHHDPFIEQFTSRIGDFADLDERNFYHPFFTDPEGGSPRRNDAMSLEELLGYEAVLWSFNYTSGQTTGLWYHEHESDVSERRLLSAYLSAGGKLFLFGNQPVSSMVSATDGGAPNREYPRFPTGIQNEEPDGFSTESFVWRFLHVRSRFVGIDRFDCESSPPRDWQTWRDGLARCVSANPAYPDLALDPMKHDAEAITDCQGYRPPPVGGLKDWEGVLRIPESPEPRPDPGLDTLYTAGPYNWSGSLPSTLEGAVIAQRYESTHADTLNAFTQGRVVLFLFQPFFFEEAATYEAGRSAVNWLMTGSDY